MSNAMIKAAGILGVLLGITAAITAAAYPSAAMMNGLIAILSFILLLVFFIFHFESFKAFSRKRSTHLGLNSVLMIVLFILIVVILNLMARQYYFRSDMSSTSRFSLAQQTIGVVENLESAIHITVFGQENSPAFKRAYELLDGYRYFNRNITYSVLDLDRAPLLAKKLGVTDYNSVVIDTGRDQTVATMGISEESITNGIIKATRKGKKKIYFTAGHGERDIMDSGREGLSKARQRLQSMGYEVTQLTLFSGEMTPDDSAVLIIAGPKERFGSEDIVKLDQYLAQGGKVIALFDPGYKASDITGRAGIQLMDGEVIDPSSNLGGRNENTPLVSSYPESRITRGFTLTTVFPGVAPVASGGLPMLYEYFRVVETSPASRLIINGKPADSAPQSYEIAAVAGSLKGSDIMMVFGDSDFASNAFFYVAGNGNLFLNCVNWIADEGDLVSIVPRSGDFIPLYLTEGQADTIFYLFVVAMPLTVFGTGFVIWFRRRRL